MFEHYRRLIALRHGSRTVRLGDFTLLEADHPALWAFTRSLQDATEPGLVVVANLSSSEDDPAGCRRGASRPRVLGNLGVAGPDEARSLQPWEARVHEDLG